MIQRAPQRIPSVDVDAHYFKNKSRITKNDRNGLNSLSYDLNYNVQENYGLNRLNSNVIVPSPKKSQIRHGFYGEKYVMINPIIKKRLSPSGNNNPGHHIHIPTGNQQSAISPPKWVTIKSRQPVDSYKAIYGTTQHDSEGNFLGLENRSLVSRNMRDQAPMKHRPLIHSNSSESITFGGDLTITRMEKLLLDQNKKLKRLITHVQFDESEANRFRRHDLELPETSRSRNIAEPSNYLGHYQIDEPQAITRSMKRLNIRNDYLIKRRM